jgi:alpha/beta superfamily hydrolase
MERKPLRHIDLYSDAGRLEALYRDFEDPAAVALVCHPHPLHGGTLHNKVVFRAARGLENADVATLRFNFRGVGTSGGKHDAGDGEQRDVEAALEWLMRKHPGKKVIVGGFSFGSWVATLAAFERPEVDALFLLGAPVNKYDLRYLQRCSKPMLFIHGSRDEFGAVDKLEALVQHIPTAETMIVNDADHFFAGQLEVVEQAMTEWANRVIAGEA